MASEYIGIDLHRRRSVIVRLTPRGEVLEEVRIDNDPVGLALEAAKAGPQPEVVLEATYGWYWAVDVLQACVARWAGGRALTALITSVSTGPGDGGGATSRSSR